MKDLGQRIGQLVGQTPQVITPLHGGMIGQVYRVDFGSEQSIVAKTTSAANGEILQTEGYMLRYLMTHSQLPVPKVLHSDAQLLLLTFIPGSSHFTTAAQRHAAELLADLHTLSAENFGMERDTVIATLPLPNPWTASWVDFFRDYRLLHLGQHAVNSGQMPHSLLQRLENFCAHLDQWLEEPDHPSLVHGDIWATNVLATESHITGFIDPAIYYGHAEVELAYITLFNTFGPAFFERYHELRPIEPGFFEVRRHIYNLYPLLVHVCEFGGSYVQSVASTLGHFGH